MESRYALRELEGAIGNDCRTLRDGRDAVFRHTAFHKRLKRDFFERRDAMSVIQSSLMSASSLASHPRMDIRSMSGVFSGMRSALVKLAFPYMAAVPEAQTGKPDYSKYFDELEEIKARRKAKEEADKPECVGREGAK